MSRRLAIVVLGLGLFAVGAIAVTLATGGSSLEPVAPVAGDGHSSVSPAQQGLRTLLVFRGAEPSPSEGTALRAQLLDGRVPAGRKVGVVLTDADCAPDAQGISHCTNALRLPNGSTLTVRHPHSMAAVPCLTPGERVLVSLAAQL